MRALIVLLVVCGSGCGPSCEDMGGTLKYSHTTLVPVRINNITTFNQVPQYVCVMPEEAD
ncbi:MAG: hypothetical protein AAF098_13460 [Pseudomonadota bacterium]